VTFFLMASSFWALSRTVLHGGLLGMEADLVGIARLKNAGSTGMNMQLWQENAS
jgi:hypothetical protein